MTAQSVLAPYPFFTDRTGAPLNSGRVYIGTAGANPITNPISVYFDAGLTIPAAQPIRTSGGLPLNNGAPARLFVDADSYSMVVQDSNGSTLTSSLNTSLLTVSEDVGIPQTAAELAAGATVVVATRQPGDFVRYGFSTTASGATNSAAANAAMAANSFCFCDDPGTYVCSEILLPQSNQTIRLAQGVILQASVKPWNSAFVHITGVSGVRWHGGVIDGNKAANPTGVVFNMRIMDSTDIKVFGVKSINAPSNNTTLGAGGDGFYVGGNTAAGSSDVELIGCFADGNVRQGLSIVKGSRIKASACSFINTTGNNPGGGVDVEGNVIGDRLRDIVIQACTISGNHYGIVVTQAAKYVTVTGNSITDNRFAAVNLGDCESVIVSDNVIKSGITTGPTPLIEIVSAQYWVLADNIIEGGTDSNERAAIRLLGLCDHGKVTGNLVRNSKQQGIQVGQSSQTANFRNVTIQNNTFLDCVSAGTTAVIAVTGNTMGGFYPDEITILGNQVIDTRSGGNEADFAFSFASFPSAIYQNFRVDDNHIDGPAAAVASGTDLPLRGRVTFNPGGALADGAQASSATFTIVGARLGDMVEVYPPYSLQKALVVGDVTATDTCQITVQNETGGVLAFTSGVWKAKIRKLDRY